MTTLGCGVADQKPGTTVISAGPRATPVAPDTMAGARRTDSSRQPKARPLRDSAFGPRMEVDSAGRLRPVKKP